MSKSTKNARREKKEQREEHNRVNEAKNKGGNNSRMRLKWIHIEKYTAILFLGTTEVSQMIKISL